MPKISVIILTYNSEKYLENLIKSIKQHNKANDYEVIVVDNNSEDSTVRVAQRLDVVVIKNPENYGFAKGINIGVKNANGEYVLFINPDGEFKSGSIIDLVKVFEEKNKVGIVGGKIISKNGSNERSAGKFPGLFEVLTSSLGLDEVLGNRFSPTQLEAVDFVSGAFMMLKRDFFNEISGFDENLFMYMEDVEISYRVKKKGFKTYFSPAATIIHESHGSSSRGFAIKNIFKGYIYFYKKHGNIFSLTMVRFILLFKAATLVILGKIMNNKSLTKTYEEAFRMALR